MGEITDGFKEFTIGLAERGKLSLEQVRFPVTAQAGEEITVLVTVKNVGAAPCQSKACLYEGHVTKGDTLKKIDCEASPCSTELITFEWCKLDPGQTEMYECNTKMNPLWAMPDHPWNLTVHAVREG